MAKLVAGALVSWFAYQSVPTYFSTTTTPEIWARFLVVYAGGALMLVPLMGAIGKLLEEAIDSFPVLSYLKLNTGDSNLIDEFGARKLSVITKIAISAVFSIALGIVSAKLEKLI
ncbi:MAG: hypothetical protein WCK81_00030 [Betaproteobacteria bacterium]